MNAIPQPNIEAVASLRARLWDGGWRPVALYNPDQTHTAAHVPQPIRPDSRGKRPMGNDWESRARRSPPEAAELVPDRRALNTGLLADGLRILDFDIDDGAIVGRLRALAIERFGETLIRTRGNSSRCAMVYRAAEGAPTKRKLVGASGKIEVLGYGQQLHAFGAHPSGASLHWAPEAPDTTTVATLPAVTEAQLDVFLAAVAPMIGAEATGPSANPASLASGNQASVFGPSADSLDVAAALAAIPNEGPADWEHWNRIGMATWAATGGSMSGFGAWCGWSERHPTHDDSAARERWQHYAASPPTNIGAGTLFRMAVEARPTWRKPSGATATPLHADATVAAVWERPDMSLARSHVRPAPPFPQNVFSPTWERWISDAAEGAGAPVDYVAGVLIATVGALLGNARHVRAWGVWTEPPTINVALIGLPSSNKSPAMKAIERVLANMELDENTDLGERRRTAATAAEEANLRLAAWKVDVKTAMGENRTAPTMPEGAQQPDQVQRRRIFSTDPTVAKAARLSQNNPRGMLLFRDELAGWLAGMASRDRGEDRGFWLQAWNGSAWTPDRVKDGDDEVSVPYLTWGIVGGIQPDRVASLMLAGDDDGLTARFLPFWPDPRPPSRPTSTPDVAWAERALGQIRAIPWQGPECGVIDLSPVAADVLQEWREGGSAREVGEAGQFLSWLGKLPGFALRLAAILEHLAWTETQAAAPPLEVGEVSMLRAVTFLSDYAIPMARRAYGEAACPKAERDARRLARWLLRREPIPQTINARELRRMADGPGLADAAATEAALVELAEAGWVRPAPTRAGSTAGRARSDWQVNPAIAEARDGLG